MVNTRYAPSAVLAVMLVVVATTGSEAQTLIHSNIPVSIGAPGSYKLMENLLVTDSYDTPAVIIGVGDVTLDLNGFSIVGICDYETARGRAAIEIGTNVYGPYRNGIVIKNGHIRCYPQGVYAVGGQVRIENVSFNQIYWDGVSGAADTVVVDSTFIGIGLTAQYYGESAFAIHVTNDNASLLAMRNVISSANGGISASRGLAVQNVINGVVNNGMMMGPTFGFTQNQVVAGDFWFLGGVAIGPNVCADPMHCQ